jgi:hypothetical protein
LTTLERSGVGLRRAEGFGHLLVNPSPWRAAWPARPAEQPSPAAALVQPLLDAGMASRLRPWLLPHLKALAEAHELGATAAAEAILEERRLRGLPASTVAAVRALVELDEVDQLRDAATLLEDPRWR